VLKNQELFESSLMALFTVQQEIREYLYAVQYLPHWVYVPDAALDAMFRGDS
jgi:predicted trehalose synthase